MKKALSFVSIILGIVTALAGLWLIGLYLYGLVGSIDQADKSFIFWGIALAFIGFIILAIGTIFTIVAVKSLHSNIAYRWTMGILVAWLVTVPALLIANERNVQRGREWTAANQAKDTFLATANKIAQVSVPSNDTNGFTIRVTTSGGFDGDYKLTVRITTDQTTFLETSENRILGTNMVTIDKNIDYQTLFARCKGDLQNSDVYVCIKNIMADTTLKITAEIVPIRATAMAISPDKLLQAASSQKTEVSLEVENKNNEITVRKFTKL